MIYNSQILLLALIISFNLNQSYASPLELVLMSQENGEACLDGSPPGYYFQEGSGNGKDKYIVYFMGGEFCVGTTQEEVIQSCIQRTQSFFGTSTLWPQTMDSFPGILDQDPANNFFADWNHILVNYCDGAFHQGYRSEPIRYGDRGEKKLYFRGSINTESMIAHLLNQKGMINASQVVISGQSAGGIATLLWADYLQDRLKNTTRYWAIVDSGYGVNTVNVQTKSNLALEQWKALYEVANQDEQLPNVECAEAYFFQSYKCFFGQYSTLFIRSPLFIAQSEYDSWMIPHNLGVDCINSHLSLSNCSLEQKNQISSYRQMFLSSLNRTLGQRPGRGAWSIACSIHVLTMQAYNLALYEVPVNSGNTLNQAIAHWIQGISPDQSIDSVTWPNNSRCASVPIPPSGAILSE